MISKEENMVELCSVGLSQTEFYKAINFEQLHIIIFESATYLLYLHNKNLYVQDLRVDLFV